MKLELGTFHVRDMAFAGETRLEKGTLYVHRQELTSHLLRDKNFSEVEIDIAKPGDNVRIVHVLDVIEPRIKVEGPGVVFPGFLGSAQTVGTGKTNRLAGVAVVEAGLFDPWRDGVGLFREAIIDMSGPGAELCLFSDTLNLVLTFHRARDVHDKDYDQSIRMAGLRASTYLAEVTKDLTPDESQAYELGKADPSLPKVAHIHHIYDWSRTLFVQTFIYGLSSPDLLSTCIHPNEMMDGAVVNGNCMISSIRVTTYQYCNNAIINELYRRHGKELDFVGVVLASIQNESQPLKVRSTSYSAKLAKLLGADGVIVSHECGGHSGVDLVLTATHAAQLGVKPVLVTWEYGGKDGRDQPLVDFTPESDAIVSTRTDQTVYLPGVDKILGGNELIGVEGSPRDGFSVSIRQIMGGRDNFGERKFRVQAY